MKGIFYLKGCSAEDVTHLKDQFTHIQNWDFLQDSDFSAHRGGFLKRLVFFRKDLCVVAVKDIRYVRWLLIIFIMSRILGKQEGYVIDLQSSCQKVTYRFLLWACLISLWQGAVQISVGAFCPIYLHFLRKSRVGQINDSFALQGDAPVMYCKTSESYGLSHGGSFGHTLGMVNGFRQVHTAGVEITSNEPIVSLTECHQCIVPPDSYGHYICIYHRFRYNRALLKALRSRVKAPALIYARATRDIYAPILYALEQKIPCVLEVNSEIEWDLLRANHWSQRLFSRSSISVESWCLEFATIITVVSEPLKRMLVKRGVKESKILVVPNAVDSRIFKPMKPLRRRYLSDSAGCWDSRRKVAFVGTFGVWHGVEVLSRAILKLNEQGVNADFYFIGDGPLRSAVELDLKKSENVFFQGLVPYSQVAKELNEYDILVCPTLTSSDEPEGFIGSPTKLFEYMAVAKIVIASSVGQITEVLNPALSVVDDRSAGGFCLSGSMKDSCGILVESANFEALAHAIRFAVEGRDLGSLGVNARERVIKRYTWESNARLVLAKALA